MERLVPYLSERELRARAAAFLAEHHPDGGIPVPIESIVEFKLGLDIVPTPGLSGSRGINGYLSSDRSSIYIDAWILQNQLNRYIFTLAHEISHLVLHTHLYTGFRSEEDWLAFHEKLSTHSLGSAEYQANTFAGLVLVPETPLRDVAEAKFQQLSSVVRNEYPEIDLTGEAFWSYVADAVGNEFQVSAQTARIRLENDGVWGKIQPTV